VILHLTLALLARARQLRMRPLLTPSVARYPTSMRPCERCRVWSHNPSMLTACPNCGHDPYSLLRPLVRAVPERRRERDSESWRARVSTAGATALNLDIEE
jgi:hypothetical protein